MHVFNETHMYIHYSILISRSRKPRLTAVGIRCADHATPSTRKGCALTSPTRDGRLVGIVRLRTTATEFSFLVYLTSEEIRSPW
jgi:hypothetical protein